MSKEIITSRFVKIFRIPKFILVLLCLCQLIGLRYRYSMGEQYGR